MLLYYYLFLVMVKIISSIIILAAGLGKRMHSELPKVLHKVADKSLIRHVIESALALNPSDIHVVYGYKGAQVQQELTDIDIVWVEQAEQLGTGHAVAQAIPNISDDAMVLVLCGDVPLIKPTTLEVLYSKVDAHSLGVLTVMLDNPTGYGRIIRNAQGNIVRIVEEKDANDEIKKIKEVNTGIFVIPAAHLRRWLGLLKNDNAQGEYYLTDIITLAVAEHMPIHTTSCENSYEVMGVNNRQHLALLERHYQEQQVTQLMLGGVSVRDPARVDIRGTVQAGRDVLIDIDVIFEGTVIIGNNVTIGAHVVIRDTTIADNVEILSHCVIDHVVIGSECRIGPFARLRPDSVLGTQVHIGNFVEIKKTSVAHGSKISHLSYIGDAEVGSHVNIGAGTITCNYDGANKYKTTIGDGAFIGSDTQLIAPVSVGAGATIGAGSTVTRNTPPDALTLSRSVQKTISAWQRPVKKK